MELGGNSVEKSHGKFLPPNFFPTKISHRKNFLHGSKRRVQKNRPFGRHILLTHLGILFLQVWNGGQFLHSAHFSTTCRAPTSVVKVYLGSSGVPPWSQLFCGFPQGRQTLNHQQRLWVLRYSKQPTNYQLSGKPHVFAQFKVWEGVFWLVGLFQLSNHARLWEVSLELGFPSVFWCWEDSVQIQHR